MPNAEITIELVRDEPSSRDGDIAPNNTSSTAFDQAVSSLDHETTNAAIPDVPYSTFRICEKRFIVFLVALAGFFSPFNAFIYFPALQDIANTFLYFSD
ncbi:hypothetical protein MMC34_001844 [Xylographa carneopallida]|nr:hypothetical protein [Xylographa carneopallida]